jgi:hypothetical protein
MVASLEYGVPIPLGELFHPIKSRSLEKVFFGNFMHFP